MHETVGLLVILCEINESWRRFIDHVFAVFWVNENRGATTVFLSTLKYLIHFGGGTDGAVVAHRIPESLPLHNKHDS
jgi:hypothetical protein